MPEKTRQEAIRGCITPFMDFEQYIFDSGLSDGQRQAFRDFLRKLYDLTGSLWKPWNCYATEHVEVHAKKVLNQMAWVNVRVEPRNYRAGHHFWLVLLSPPFNGELVVDPTGVPTSGDEIDWIKTPGLVKPFFGNRDLARGNHKMVYESGRHDPTYHVFHP